MDIKRILLISYHTCPLAQQEGKETGGMNVYVFELARNLSRLGYLVDVITRSQDHKIQKIVLVEKNFRVIHLIAGPQSPLPKNKLPVYISDFLKSFYAFIAHENISYDLIHAHYYQSGIVGQDIKKKLHLPLVITFHTLALMKQLVARSQNEFESQERITHEFNLVKDANAIITPSVSDKEYLQYLYEVPAPKIFEIPPGVNDKLFKPIEKTIAKKRLHLNLDEKIILFVGRIEPLKGIDLILYALKILLSQQPNEKLRLLIVGGDTSQHITKWSAQLKHLETLRQTLQLATVVDFVGQQPQDKLPFYYNAAQMVVMPSHYESFGMAAAEAMACGTPVITTNVTGISYLIDELRSTLITTVNNPLLLASQMRELLSDKKYTNIQKKLLRNRDSLCWDCTVKNIVEVYKKVI